MTSDYEWQDSDATVLEAPEDDETENLHLQMEATPTDSEKSLGRISKSKRPLLPSGSESESMLSAQKKSTKPQRKSPRKKTVVHSRSQIKTSIMEKGSPRKSILESRLQTRRWSDSDTEISGVPSTSRKTQRNVLVHFPTRSSPRKSVIERRCLQTKRWSDHSDTEISGVKSIAQRKQNSMTKQSRRENPTRTQFADMELSSDSEMETTPRNATPKTPKETTTAVEATGTHSSGKNIRRQIETVLDNQREIIQHLLSLKKEMRTIKTDLEKKKEESKEPVEVPNKIRNAVKDSFINGQERDLTWNYKKRFNDEENKVLTDFIKNSVLGIQPDVSSDVLNAAVKRYFTSKKEAANRAAKNKSELHKKRQATYERKKEKVRRRLQAVDRKTNWGKEKKENVKKLLKSSNGYKYMSSDEDCEDGFISHPLSWESVEFRQVKDSLDKTFMEICPPRSKRLLAKRSKGTHKNEDPPQVEEDFLWIINEDQ